MKGFDNSMVSKAYILNNNLSPAAQKAWLQLSSYGVKGFAIVMFKQLLNIMFLFFALKLNAQTNLAPNPSFEDTLACPVGPGPIPVLDWIAIYGSPDYFNSVYHSTCGYSGDVPNNFLGYQQARSGNSYMGISTYCAPSSCGPNYREAIQSQMLDTFQLNKKYCVSFFVNLVHNVKYASDDIGCYFSTTSNIPFPASAQINNIQGSFITDTVNWTLIKGIYTALGNERFINIGNFKNDANTTVIVSNASSSNPNAYYFIDDVSIYELPEIDAGINDTINASGSVQLNASCTGCWAGLQYMWYPSIGLSDSSILNPIASPTQTTTYYFGLIDTTGNIPCMVDYKDSVTVFVTGIDEYEWSKQIKIYPNPSNGNFLIDFSETDNYLIEITNSFGACVFKESIKSNKFSIVATLSDGVYILKITNSTNRKNIHKKIIISK